MSLAGRKSLKNVGAKVAWIAGAGFLFVVVFTISFYLAVKMEMRSTEAVVPDLVGMTREDAERAAGPVGLRIEVADQRHDPTLSSGRVLAQEPPGGSDVRRGRRVKVVLSLGGKVFEVPDLVGRQSRTVDIALRREGFLPGDEVEVFDAVAPRGTVIAQVPPPGSPSVTGERVHRLVSLGPPDVVWVMPDLTDHPQGYVKRWLEKSGFRLGPVQQVSAPGSPPETVVGQSPPAGHPVRPRDVVQLRVAR